MHAGGVEAAFAFAVRARGSELDQQLAFRLEPIRFFFPERAIRLDDMRPYPAGDENERGQDELVEDTLEEIRTDDGGNRRLPILPGWGRGLRLRRLLVRLGHFSPSDPV